MHLGCSDPTEIARRLQCHNNVKQIAIALHSYHEVYGCLPPAYVADKNGKPMHSWRTLILPYLEQKSLYNAYNFNEPWDGPNNRKLANTSLPVFNCPSAKKWDTPMTSYVAVTGPGTMWPGRQSTKFEDVTDGLSSTIVLVEIADSGIHWMEPRDITLEEALGNSGNSIAQVPSSVHHSVGGYFVRSLPLAGFITMSDGYGEFFCDRPSTDDIAAMLSINGGETVDLENISHTFSQRDNVVRYDRFVGLPLFLIFLVWFWIRMVEEPDKLKSDRAKT